MVSVFLFFAVLLCGAAVAQAQEIDATTYCFQCSQRRNHKDAYPDPAGDCHSFYKCQYFNETYATGIKLSCPVGTYWHDEILACLPEGPVPCSDNCQDLTVQAHGCYAQVGNCASYFVCSNTASYAFCCPPKTSFNAASCQCEASETCTDACVIVSPPSTTEVPPQNFGTYCIDSFGSTLQPTNDPAVFQLVSGDHAYNLNCAPGTTFSLDTCRCEGKVIPVTQPQSRQCVLYLPFDNDIKDYSSSAFWTELVQTAGIDNAVAAQGAGSLAVNGGHVEIPGTKSLDFGLAIGICVYYRCNPEQSASCAGGILSGNKDAAASEFNFIIAALGVNEALARGSLLASADTFPLTIDPATNAPSGFTQICANHNGTHKNVYINNIEVATIASSTFLSYAHCPIVAGTDQKYGDYHGWVDEVLLCPFGLTASEVNAHWSGRAALAAAGLIPS